MAVASVALNYATTACVKDRHQSDLPGRRRQRLKRQQRGGSSGIAGGTRLSRPDSSTLGLGLPPWLNELPHRLPHGQPSTARNPRNRPAETRRRHSGGRLQRERRREAALNIPLDAKATVNPRNAELPQLVPERVPIDFPREDKLICRPWPGSCDCSAELPAPRYGPNS